MVTRRALAALPILAILAFSCSRSADTSHERVVETPRVEPTEHFDYPHLEEDGDATSKIPPVPMPGGRPSHPKLFAAAPGVPLDRDAMRSAVSSVPYKDCGSGGPGKVLLTFAPTGRVRHVSISAGLYDAATTACIIARFRGATIPPFDGPDANVGLSISL